MITIETAVAFALRDAVVMDALGEALRSDLVTANPFYRRVVEFADDFLTHRRALPKDGDWRVWIDALPEGMIRDGTREALGRLLVTDTSAFHAEFFAETAIEQLRQVAVRVALARMNETPQIDPESFAELARRLESIRGGGLQGLANVSDVELWATPARADDRLPTGFASLDRLIGGWGKELIMVFADTGVGKSMMLQNWAVGAALRGKRVLHVTLELGLRPQIQRYYRQIAQATRSEVSDDLDEVKRRLRHWVKLAKGDILVTEQPAFGLDYESLRRLVERVSRANDGLDVLILDYMDLMAVGRGKQRSSTYENLGVLTHELRELCRAFDMTVITASQSVRRPANKDRLTIKDMGDSYQKVRGVDLLLSLVQTEEEKEMHQGRLGVLKARDSGGWGAEIPLYINREMALIGELDHPNTQALMKRLGHLPTQKQSPVPSVAQSP